MISESEVEKIFLHKVRTYVYEDRRSKLHLTDLTSPCFRKVFFEKRDPLPEDTENILRLWRGKALHELNILQYHELELEYDGVKTRIDEYDPELKILVEKKTADFIPKDLVELKKYYQHYLDQVAFEWLFLVNNGHDVRQCFILFIKDGPLNGHGRKPVKAFDITSLIEFDKVKEKFITQKETLQTLLQSNEPPEIPETFTAFDYPCSYCKYRPRCW